MKILLADDHVLFRDALTQFIRALQPDWKMYIVSDFLAVHKMLLSGDAFDIVLLDLRMPGMNGLEGLKTLRENFPHQMVAILSGIAEEHHVRAAMTLGARAYFPKTLSGKNLCRAIEMVVISKQKFVPMDETGTKIMPAYFDDFNYFSQSVTQDIKIDNQNEDKSKITINRLTKREREILYHLSRGLSNKDIAEELGLKIATVKLHVSGVCKKLDVSNRTQAAIIAHQNGIANSA